MSDAGQVRTCRGDAEVLQVASVEDMEALGRRLADELRPGDLVLLDGPLGAGKTALTRGIAAGLHVEGRVTSPTFIIARVHAGAVPLVHVDAYRLGGGDELLDLDLDLDASVTVVEWADRVAAVLPAPRLRIAIERSDDADDDVRRVTLRRP